MASNEPATKLSAQDQERSNTTPQTDPTNPSNDQAAGEWTSSEKTAVRKVDEPGRGGRDQKG